MYLPPPPLHFAPLRPFLMILQLHKKIGGATLLQVTTKNFQNAPFQCSYQRKTSVIERKKNSSAWRLHLSENWGHLIGWITRLSSKSSWHILSDFKLRSCFQQYLSDLRALCVSSGVFLSHTIRICFCTCTKSRRQFLVYYTHDLLAFNSTQ